LDVLRWIEVKTDVSEAQNIEQAAVAFGEKLKHAMSNLEGLNACVRVVLTGRCLGHGRLSADPEALAANIRAVASEVSNGKAWIEKVQLKTGPVIDFDGLAASDTPQGELLRYLKELAENSQAFEQVGLDTTALKSKISGSGVEMQEEDAGKMLSDVRDILLTMLADEESLEG
jgi:hypothetical protein